MMYQNDILPVLTTKRIVLSNLNRSSIPSEPQSESQRAAQRAANDRRERERDSLSASERARMREEDDRREREGRESGIKIEFLIRSKEQNPDYSWFMDQSMSPFINAHFILLDDSTADFLPQLISLENRRAALEELQLIAPHASVTLSDILKREFHTVTPATELSSYYIHDIYHEIEMAIPDYSKTRNENIHLVSFFHLDVESYMQHYNILSLPYEENELDSIGGSLVYDLLLTRENNKLIIPAFRNIYFIETSRNIETSTGTVNRVVTETYSGPVHYHDSENPGPDGYIGWMAGHDPGEMGPQLQERQVRNRKVISDSYYSENAESIFSINCDLQYSDSIPESLISEHLDPLSSAESQYELENKLENILNKVSFTEERANRTIVDYNCQDTSHINVIYDPNDPTGIPLQQSNYGCVVGIDFYQIVKNNSHFGNIVAFHKDKGNMQIINDILYKSFITNISVLRHRVQDYPLVFSDQCTPRYDRFDPNEPDKLLVHAEDRETVSFVYPIPSSYLKGRLIPAETPNASIEEVDLVNVDTLPDGSVVYIETPEHLRSFVVRDRDLFHNYSAGKYTYTFKISLNDGVKKVIKDLLRYVDSAKRGFLKYYFQAKIPVIRDNGVYVSGHYDFVLNELHQTFRELNFTTELDVSVQAFAKMVLFLTGDEVSESDLTTLRSSLSPEVTTITTLEDFSAVLDSLESSLLNLLLSRSKYHDAHNSSALRKNKRANVKDATGFETNIIQVEAKTGIIVDAFSETTLMADFSIREVHDDHDSVPNIARIFEENSSIITPDIPTIRLPKRFITVIPEPFEALQYGPIIDPSPRFQSAEDSTLLSVSPVANVLQDAPTMQSDDSPVMPVVAPSSPSAFPVASVGVYGASTGANNSATTTTRRSGSRTMNRIQSRRNRRAKKSSSGGISEVSNISSYSLANTATRAALDIKIDTVRILDSQDNGIINKHDSFFPDNLQQFGGGILFGPSDKFKNFTPNVSLFDPNHPLSDNRPNISSALRKAICDAAYKGEDPQSVLDSIESMFEDIVITREGLGDIFNRVMSFVGNTSRVPSNMASVSFEDKYLGKEGIQQARRVLKENSYEKEKSKLSVIGPKQMPKDINIINLASAPRLSTRKNKKFVFAKFNTMKKNDNVISVNNGYLLEV